MVMTKMTWTIPHSRSDDVEYDEKKKEETDASYVEHLEIELLHVKIDNINYVAFKNMSLFHLSQKKICFLIRQECDVRYFM